MLKYFYSRLHLSLNKKIGNFYAIAYNLLECTMFIYIKLGYTHNHLHVNC